MAVIREEKWYVTHNSKSDLPLVLKERKHTCDISMPFVKFSCIGKASVSVPAMEDADDEFTAGEDGLPVKRKGKKIGLKLLFASALDRKYYLQVGAVCLLAFRHGLPPLHCTGSFNRFFLLSLKFA